jgi:hypothetical protein
MDGMAHQVLAKHLSAHLRRLINYACWRLLVACMLNKQFDPSLTPVLTLGLSWCTMSLQPCHSRSVNAPPAEAAAQHQQRVNMLTVHLYMPLSRTSQTAATCMLNTP